MPLLGAHMSIAGGLYKAVEAAAAFEMEVVQIFTHSPSQWAVKPTEVAQKTKNSGVWSPKVLLEDDAARFLSALKGGKITHPLSHSSYLINLATANAELREKSIAAMVGELERAAQLGIAYVVLHPGAHPGIEEAAGIENVISALDEIHRRLPKSHAQILLETTAGQGSSLGHTFEQLAAMFAGVQHPERLGVCVDTCHIFAAGYPLRELREYTETFRRFDATLGLDRIRAFHVNDSKKDLGSRVDRHEHIGRGKLGMEPFEHLMNDRRFREIPMYLETPKEMHEGEHWDTINLRTLRGLVKKAGRKSG